MIPGLITPRGLVQSIPPVVTFRGIDSSNSASSTYDHTGSFGPVDPDRYIIIGATARQSGGARTLNSVTINGETAINLVSMGSNAALAELWMALVPTSTSGTVNLTFNNTVQRSAIVCWSVIGDFNIIPFDTAQVASSGSGAYSTTIDIPQGGFCIAVAHWNVDSSSMSWSGLTEDNDDSYGGSGVQRFSGASSSTMTAETNRTIQVTPTGSSNERRLAVASFSPA